MDPASCVQLHDRLYHRNIEPRTRWDASPISRGNRITEFGLAQLRRPPVQRITVDKVLRRLGFA
jgi:hypothetical protein